MKARLRLFCYRLARGLFWILFILFFRVRVEGRRNLSRVGGGIIVANHQSLLDPILLALGTRRPIHFMARDTLFKTPVFGPLISYFYAFAVKREGGDIPGMREAIRLARAGELVIVFPEGTRTDSGRIRPFHRGVSSIARLARVPIFPALITGAFEAWPRGRHVFRCASIRVWFGPHIPVELVLQDPRLHERLYRDVVAMERSRMDRGTSPGSNDLPRA